MPKVHPFNPLSRESLAASVAGRLLSTDVVQLSDFHEATGAGIYAIYYVGSFLPYAPIAEATRNNSSAAPIYVGKAEHPGARKGLRTTPRGDASPLRKRIKEHADSIRLATTTLRLEDFKFRFLPVDDIWIPLGESTMIQWFQPIWNVVVDGFGNHAPGAGRHLQRASSWDVLHPGRGFARNLPAGEPPKSIKARISKHLRERSPLLEPPL